MFGLEKKGPFHRQLDAVGLNDQLDKVPQRDRRKYVRKSMKSNSSNRPGESRKSLTIKKKTFRERCIKKTCRKRERE